MIDPNNIRDGLILELQKLQQRQSLLGSLYYKNIAQRKLEQAKLKKSEKRYLDLLINLDVGVVIHAPDTSIVMNNSKALELLGLSEGQMKGKTTIDLSWNFIYENYIPVPIEEYPVNKIARSRKIIKDFIVGFKQPATNNVVWVSVNGFPVLNNKGEISEIIISFIDITHQKQSEQSLHASKDYLDKIINSIASPIFVKDDTFRFCLVNDSLCSFLNLKREELIGKNGYEHFPKEQFEVLSAKDKEVFTTGKENINEEFITDGQGKIRTIVTHKTLYTDKEGHKFLVGVINNITERKQAEMMLKDEKDLLRTILKVVENPIFLKDNDHRVTFANRAFLDFFGLDENHVIGKTLAENIPKEEMEYFLKIDRSVLDTGIPSHLEEELTVGGKLHTIITSKSRFINKSGEKFLVGSIYDITERKQKEAALIIANKELAFQNNEKEKRATELIVANKELAFQNKEKEKRAEELIVANKELAFQNEEKEKRAEELIVANKELAFQNEEKEKRAAELVVAKERAEESDRLKSAFLANMSHEIRTPMNGILGFAGLLKEPGLSGEKQQKYIEIIEISGDRMLNIINNIVDISKIESGLMKVYIKETNINEQLENIYNFFKPEAEAKGIKLSFKKTLSEKEAVIKTDAEKINAILSNLVKNAIKFTNQGAIEFGAAYASSTIGQNELKFFVKDTGIGIPKDRQIAIFERFIQADIHDKMAFQGAGLGLSIAKAYVELLGGKIWVENKESKGSTFYFTIPCNQETKEKSTVEKDAALDTVDKVIGKLKILIVDDDELSENLLSLMVKEFSSEIMIARNGIEAVEICRNHPDIDLILMDVKMPKLNGYEATKQIREFNKDVIIIAQTAYGLSGEKEQSKNAGCTDYISKPILSDNLTVLIRKYFNN